MSVADLKYTKLILDIYENGEWDHEGEVRTKYEDGTPAYTKSVFGRQVKFEEGEIPILTSKFVGSKTAFKEILLFWVHQTTNAQDFEDMNVKIWREWYKEIDGVLGLGRSYGYQLKKSNQVEKLIEGIKTNPLSRRHLVSYWNEEDKEYKTLQECVWAMQFNIRKGKLDMLLIQRSVDAPLGLPYNWIQYFFLLNMIAQATGLQVGTFTHQMGNIHYYDRHEKALLEQISLNETHEQPEMWINPEVKDFFNFTPDDIKLVNYNHSGKVPYEVAI